jgi:hypothetical protein
LEAARLALGQLQQHPGSQLRLRLAKLQQRRRLASNRLHVWVPLGGGTGLFGSPGTSFLLLREQLMLQRTSQLQLMATLLQHGTWREFVQRATRRTAYSNWRVTTC